MGHNRDMNFDEINPVINLSDEESWAMLGSQEIGRLGTAVADEPEIFPVNFVVDGSDIVFRTAEGSKLLELTVNNRVAFEVDNWDAKGGWSVLVRGTARALEGADEIAAAEQLPLKPWVPTLKKIYVRVTPKVISGRRFLFGDEPEW